MSRRFPTHTPLGQAMTAAGYTSSRMSALTGVHNRTLTEYLAGRAHPTLEHSAVLSDALGIAPEDLFPQSVGVS